MTIGEAIVAARETSGPQAPTLISRMWDDVVRAGQSFRGGRQLERRRCDA
jgi:hypothetical protein